jgi:thiamine-phosphate diphosphorylase
MKPILCLVTDRRRLTPAAAISEQEDRLVAMVSAAARAGISMVQVRERDLEGGPMTCLVARCVDAVRGTSTRVLVNDRLDVALAAGAHGVHLPSHGVPADRIRAVAPRGLLIGRSVHDSAEAALAARDGALDYLIFGTVFPSASKPGVTAAGLERLAETARAVSLPVLAIGGITTERIRSVMASGAAGVAAVGLFTDLFADGADDLQLRI